MIAGAGARHVKQVPFAVIDFFEIRIVRDILDTLCDTVPWGSLSVSLSDL
jgi:hypothetical protein